MKVETLPGSTPMTTPVRNPKTEDADTQHTGDAFSIVIDQVTAEENSPAPTKTARLSSRREPAAESLTEDAAAGNPGRTVQSEPDSGRPPVRTLTGIQKSADVLDEDGCRSKDDINLERGRTDHVATPAPEEGAGTEPLPEASLNVAETTRPNHTGTLTGRLESARTPEAVAPAPVIPSRQNDTACSKSQDPEQGMNAIPGQTDSAPGPSRPEPLPARAPEGAEKVLRFHLAVPHESAMGNKAPANEQAPDAAASFSGTIHTSPEGQPDDSVAGTPDARFIPERSRTVAVRTDTMPDSCSDTPIPSFHEPGKVLDGTSRETSSEVRNVGSRGGVGEKLLPVQVSEHPVMSEADGESLKALPRNGTDCAGHKTRETVQEPRTVPRRESVQAAAPANPQGEARRATPLPGWEHPFVDDSWIVDRKPSLDANNLSAGDQSKSEDSSGGKAGRPAAPRLESAEIMKVDAGKAPDLPLSGGTPRASESAAPAGSFFQSVLRGDPVTSTSWGNGAQIAFHMAGSEPNPAALTLKPGNAGPPEGIDFLMQLAERIQVQLRNGENIIKIQLKPDTFGRLEIRAETSHGAMTATIVTESAGVKEYLDHNLHILQQSLQDQGLKVDRIQVAVQEGFVSQQSTSGYQDSRSGSGQSGNFRSAPWTDGTPGWRNEEPAPDTQTLTVLGPHSTFHTVA